MLKPPILKYIVFIFQEDDPGGGMNDAVKSFDDMDDARNYAAKKVVAGEGSTIAQIVSRRTWVVKLELWLVKGVLHEDKFNGGNS